MIAFKEPKEPYEKKFKGFIKMCNEAKASGQESVIIANPQILGDDYEEIIESLNRLAAANLSLNIAVAQRPPSR